MATNESKRSLPRAEVCPKCRQPDSCGDCNHLKLSDKEALKLGAVLPHRLSDKELTRAVARYARRHEYYARTVRTVSVLRNAAIEEWNARNRT